MRVVMIDLRNRIPRHESINWRTGGGRGADLRLVIMWWFSPQRGIGGGGLEVLVEKLVKLSIFKSGSLSKKSVWIRTLVESVIKHFENN